MGKDTRDMFWMLAVNKLLYDRNGEEGSEGRGKREVILGKVARAITPA